MKLLMSLIEKKETRLKNKKIYPLENSSSEKDKIKTEFESWC